MTNTDVVELLPAVGGIVVDAAVGEDMTLGAEKLKVYEPCKGTSLFASNVYVTV